MFAYKLFFPVFKAFCTLFYVRDGVITEHGSKEYIVNEGYRSEYVKEFVIYGCYSIIRRWLTAENPETPEDITNIILELIERL